MKVTVRIDRATGKVLSVDAKKVPDGASGVESCVESAVRSAEFPADGEGVQTHSRMLTL